MCTKGTHIYNMPASEYVQSMKEAKTNMFGMPRDFEFYSLLLGANRLKVMLPTHMYQ